MRSFQPRRWVRRSNDIASILRVKIVQPVSDYCETHTGCVLMYGAAQNDWHIVRSAILTMGNLSKEQRRSSLLLQAEGRILALQDRLEKLEKQNAALQLEQAALTVRLLCATLRIPSPREWGPCMPAWMDPSTIMMNGRCAAKSVSQSAT